MRERHAILAGTKSKSVSADIAKMLQQAGWHVWLYSRSAQKSDKGNVHVRPCDLTNPTDITHFLNEIPQIDLSVYLAEAGSPFGMFENLDSQDVRKFVESKILGSIYLSQAILKKNIKSSNTTQLVWSAGTPDNKEKEILLYGPINSAILELINELNMHYAEYVSAYYLTTGLMLPSTLGELFIQKLGKPGIETHTPAYLVEQVEKIIQDNPKPGMITLKKNS